MYRGWTQRDYQNKHYNIKQKDEGTLDDRGRDGGTNFILRIKEQETRLTLQEHDDDDEDIESKIRVLIFPTNLSKIFLILRKTEREIVIIYIGLNVYHPLFLSDCKEI